MVSYSPLPDWSGTVKKFFLLYMFPFAPHLPDILTAFGGIFSAFSNRPRAYYIVVYDSSNLQDVVLPPGTNEGYTSPVTLHFIESQSKTIFEYYKRKLEAMTFTSSIQPSTFLRNSYFGQDPAKFALLGGAPAVLLPEMPEGGDPTYTEAGQALASGQVLPTQFIPLYFEGGNMLQGNDFILAGKNILMGTDIVSNPVPNADATSILSEAFGGAEVIFLGASTLLNNSPSFWQLGYQPSFHIDNLVSLIGPLTDPSTGTTKMAILLADFVSSSPLTGSSLVLFDQMVAAMAEIEAQLTAQPLGGLEVMICKIPCLLVPNASSPYILSWNNCITETDGNGKVVYLPVYTVADPAIQIIISQQESEITTRLTQWGIPIIWVDNNLIFFSQQYHGSLHCMACATERG